MRRDDGTPCDRPPPAFGAWLIGAMLLLGGAPVLGRDVEDVPDSTSMAAAFREAARRAVPAVVTVRAADRSPSTGSGTDRRPDLVRTDPGGSGVVIDAGRGLVLTNDHVVEDAILRGGSLVVGLLDGRVRAVLDVKRDPRSDLALLAIDPAGLDLAAVEWGDSEELAVGDWVLAVGQPFGLSGSVSAGIVGGLGRTLSVEPYRDLIQTDAAINPGSSGGALVDLEGRLIGINVAVQTIGGGNEGVGFAVTALRARRVAEDLAAIGQVRRSAIGVRVGPADPEVTAQLDPRGAVRVESVTPGGPAGQAGIVSGDLIVSVGGRPVASPDQLVSAIEFAPSSEPLSVFLLRGEEVERMDVLPEPLMTEGDSPIGPIASPAGAIADAETPPPPEPRPAVRLPEPASSRDPSRFPSLGLRLEAPSPELADRFGIDPSLPGMVIVGIVPGGPADLGGLSPGMVVTDVLDRRVGSLTEFREVIANVPRERDLILRILNRGRAEFRIILRDGQPDRDDRTASDAP